MIVVDSKSQVFRYLNFKFNDIDSSMLTNTEAKVIYKMQIKSKEENETSISSTVPRHSQLKITVKTDDLVLVTPSKTDCVDS